MQNYTRISIFGILALIGLRVCIGWHFYMEGVVKVREGGFSSEGFLLAAKGPLAPNFRSMIWDYDGEIRLDQERVNSEFERATQEATAHFGFTDEQLRELGRIRGRYYGKNRSGRWVGKLNDVYADSQEDIYKYWESVDRVSKMEDSPTWNDVSSLRGQRESIEQDRWSSVQSALASIDAIWQQYETRLNQVATPEQRAAAGYYRFDRPGEGLFSTGFVNQVIPIFDMVVGILLMIGLLTPLASWAAAIFLIGVILTQMPGFPDTQPTYYQAIECIACIVLATTDAGRYAGLDFIPWTWWQRQRESSGGKPATTAQPAS